MGDSPGSKYAKFPIPPLCDDDAWSSSGSHSDPDPRAEAGDPSRDLLSSAVLASRPAGASVAGNGLMCKFEVDSCSSSTAMDSSDSESYSESSSSAETKELFKFGIRAVQKSDWPRPRLSLLGLLRLLGKSKGQELWS